MPNKTIKFSPKHGLNPTIPVCFFCGQQKNEIAFMGRLAGDAEAPRNLILDYEPWIIVKPYLHRASYVLVSPNSHQMIGHRFASLCIQPEPIWLSRKILSSVGLQMRP